MTPKPKIQYIGQFYVYGSEAQVLQPGASPKHRLVLPEAVRRRMEKVYVDPVAILSIAVSLVLLVSMVMGFYPPPVTTFINYVLVVLLAYVLAFSLIGLARLFAKAIRGNRILSVGFGSFVAVFCRLVCHVLSGVLIWGCYAPEGMSVWAYSIGYNGSYMICETIVSTVVMCLLASVLDFKTLKKPKAQAK